MGVVYHVKNGRPGGSVSGRIAPAEQEIAALARDPARMRGRLRSGCTVIDHPHFVEKVRTDYNLIQGGIVIDAVHVYPILLIAGVFIVDIQEFRMI